MREDMFKVIVERPRLGVRSAPRIKNRREKTGKSFIGMKRQAMEQTGWRKMLNENLSPLRRYLDRQVGRRWDDVYSEICAQLDTGSTVKMHVREHLDDFVIRHVHITADGTWLARTWSFGATLCTPDHWFIDLYVDPLDGRLKHTGALVKSLGLKRRVFRRCVVDPDLGDSRIKLSQTQELRRVNGVWFRYVFGERRKPVEPKVDDGTRSVIHTDFDRVGRIDPKTNRLILAKRQLGKKELRQRGLAGGLND